MKAQKLYRYEQINYHPGVDEHDNPLPGIGNVDLILSEFKIIKYTPKGVWIDYYLEKKFVNLEARKKFVCETKKEALISFVRRKYKYIEILNSKKLTADLAIAKGLKLAIEEHGINIERYVIRDLDGKMIY